MLRPVTLIALACLSLAACGNEPTSPGHEERDAAAADALTQTPAEVVRDVQFFLNNPEERDALYSECRNNPGALGDTPECINVLDARAEARRRAMREELRGNR